MHYRNIPKTLLFLLLCCPSMGLTGCSAVVQGDTGSFSPADYVNPFIGASTSTSAAGVYHGLGKTFPGATTPYGMVQVSPNTITGEDNSPGYSYEHTTIEGFAFTQMSGVGWFGDLGNLLVMPTTGPLQKIAGREDGSIGGYRSHYDKATETARAGYYSALLTDYGIRAESSATPHCGILRFTFPEGEQSRIQIDLARRVGGTAERQYIEVVDKHTIAGWMKCTPATGGWGNGEGQADYTVYFYAQVDKPMENYGFWSADIPDDWVRKRDEVVSVPYLQPRRPSSRASTASKAGTSVSTPNSGRGRTSRSSFVRASRSSTWRAPGRISRRRSPARRSTRLPARRASCGTGSWRASASTGAATGKRRSSTRRSTTR